MWAALHSMTTERCWESCLTWPVHTEPPAASNRREDGPQEDPPGNKRLGKKAQKTSWIMVLAGIMQLLNSASMQQGYSQLSLSLAKHTTGKWAGHVDSTQNTSECSMCTNKSTCYKSPRVMKKCWDKSHRKSDLPPTLFKQAWRSSE